MICNYCKEEISPLSKECPHCASPVQEVQVMSADERDNFRGVTIVQDTNGATFDEEFEQPYTAPQENYEPKTKRKFYYYSSASSSNTGKMSLLSKIMIILIILGIVFFVIPAILTMVLIGAVLWFVWSIFA